MKDGIKCECGEFHPFTDYIKSVWNEEIKHTCSCGKKRLLIKGEWAERKEEAK